MPASVGMYSMMMPSKGRCSIIVNMDLSAESELMTRSSRISKSTVVPPVLVVWKRTGNASTLVLRSASKVSTLEDSLTGQP